MTTPNEQKAVSDERLKPYQWGAWVLMGDPFARVPSTLEALQRRIGEAVIQAKRQQMEYEAALAAEQKDGGK